MASLKRWWIGDIAQNNLVNEFSGFGFVSGTVKPGQPSRGKAEIDTHTLVRILMMVDDDAKPSSMNGGHFGYMHLFLGIMVEPIYINIIDIDFGIVREHGERS